MEVDQSVPNISNIHSIMFEVVNELKCPPLKEHQIRTIVSLAQRQNQVNQLPTGAGKTLPIVILPYILDGLRNHYQYDISEETRVLYIVPLVNIYQTLVLEMERLDIPFQVMSAGGDSNIDSKAKVVFKPCAYFE